MTSTRIRHGLLATAAIAATLAATVPSLATASSGSLTKHTLAATPAYPSRNYYQYVPTSLPPSGQRTLVVYLHGCGQTAADAAAGTRWDELADAKGFVVVFPDQKVPGVGDDPSDGSAAGCWNTGAAEKDPRGTGELGSIAQITYDVAQEMGADPGRIFLAGVSGGAMMAASMAAVYPDLYSAIGHVANCGYLCDPTGYAAYRHMGNLARVIPVMDIQGSLDEVATMGMEEQSVYEYLGTDDWADDGVSNGSISRIPASIENRNLDAINPQVPGDLCLRDFPRSPCPGVVLGGYPVTVRTYTAGAGEVVLEAWTIHGIMHNYSGGSMPANFTDPYGPNITAAIYAFFEAHAR